MLENLVESKNNSRAAGKLYGFLFSIFLIVSAALSSATVWSLFAKDFAMGESGMELSRLVSPIPVAENQPPPVIEKPQRQIEPQAKKDQITVRKTNTARVDETQAVPDKVSTAPNAFKARPNAPFTIDPNAAETDAASYADKGRGDKNGETGFTNPGDRTAVVENDKTANVPKPPPPIKKENIKVPPVMTGGVVNGKAIDLPKPPYPAPAKAVGASGTVSVQVTIDENGNVISARAVSGHVLLRDAAERAARRARFTPTYLSKTAVKVNGIILYNFTR
jgi:protein TonB